MRYTQQNQQQQQQLTFSGSSSKLHPAVELIVGHNFNQSFVNAWCRQWCESGWLFEEGKRRVGERGVGCGKESLNDFG